MFEKDVILDCMAQKKRFLRFNLLICGGVFRCAGFLGVYKTSARKSFTRNGAECLSPYNMPAARAKGADFSGSFANATESLHLETQKRWSFR